ncbi:NADPH-dependent glutamate synthase [Oscillibacter valericigenes]|uniref:NADPH-dependent glutamate synthase n=1 Tax=Oscillibacter valericigenes TaxID=351091 RepID=UPI001F1D5ABF|nr:NADPH-dependent glutamate synthase [Oscillibacter valericigenes]MCF2617657.1 NADPH-dependent glutamate synthase [Oscillibacter valericigenes]
MANMSLTKNPMPSQDPNVRNKNFQEVALGYTEEQALDEAQRCLNCKNKPCMTGCPVMVHIPEFIAEVAKGNFEEAYQIISHTSALPAVCGRVCPQENQCEKYCVRGKKGDPVGIGRLERFVADWHNANCHTLPEKPASNGHRVAIVGSGPAGLTCAGDLARKGYEVTVFEALHLAGGVLVYGIPEFRLPKSIVQKEVDGLKALGVTIATDTVVGRTITVDELMEEQGFEAVFIGSGAGLPMFMNIPGVNYKGVFSANEFLTRINLMKAYKPDSDTPIVHPKKVAVVGGGNVAMDAARCAKRLGAEVYIVYRRGMEELPARKEEVEHAEEEGIIFKTLNNPVEILADENDNVNKIRCIQMELGEPDASGRRRPVEIPGSEFDLDVDCVIMALGTSPNPLIKDTTKGLEINKKGGIVVNEDGLTSKDNVYAGGDAVTGAATVILAMGAGKTAAKAIDEALSK